MPSLEGVLDMLGIQCHFRFLPSVVSRLGPISSRPQPGVFFLLTQLHPSQRYGWRENKFYSYIGPIHLLIFSSLCGTCSKLGNINFIIAWTSANVSLTDHHPAVKFEHWKPCVRVQWRLWMKDWMAGQAQAQMMTTVTAMVVMHQCCILALVWRLNFAFQYPLTIDLTSMIRSRGTGIAWSACYCSWFWTLGWPEDWNTQCTYSWWTSP